MANSSYMNDKSCIGATIAEIRRKQNVKLAAVSRYVPVSTLNAIEHGRIIPSISMLDAVTTGLALPVGHLDLFYLECVRDVVQRRAILLRLTEGGAARSDIQRHLRRALRTPLIPASQHWHIWYLIAEVSATGHLFRRAAVILENIRTHNPSITGESRLNILSLLGKMHLHLGHPGDAIHPLMEAVHLRLAGSKWETALYNLGLTWWQLGHYEQARLHWEQVAERTTNPELRANALIGLGNVALRTGYPDIAVRHFQGVQELYEAGGVSVDAHARALNNLLGASMKNHDVQVARTTFNQARGLVDMVESRLLQGELLETMAEWALSERDSELAVYHLQKAKEFLGKTPVVSWFAARFLEISMQQNTLGSLTAVFQDMEAMINNLHDPQVIAAIRLRMSLVAVHRMEFQLAETILNKSIASFPSINANEGG